MPTKKAPTKKKPTQVFSEGEKAAARETARERARQMKGVDGETLLREKIAEMSKADRALAERVDAIVRANAPGLAPTTWYGMPAYTRDGKAVVFFQPAQKFKARYSTIGFSDSAKLDDGSLWPISYAVTDVTPAVEAKIAALVKKAAG